jgi:predicted cupin superfamily sugar epimerase
MISDDAGEFNNGRTNMLKATKKDRRNPSIFLFALGRHMEGGYFTSASRLELSKIHSKQTGGAGIRQACVVVSDG